MNVKIIDKEITPATVSNNNFTSSVQTSVIKDNRSNIYHEPVEEFSKIKVLLPSISKVQGHRIQSLERISQRKE